MAIALLTLLSLAGAALLPPALIWLTSTYKVKIKKRKKKSRKKLPKLYQ